MFYVTTLSFIFAKNKKRPASVCQFYNSTKTTQCISVAHVTNCTENSSNIQIHTLLTWCHLNCCYNQVCWCGSTWQQIGFTYTRTFRASICTFARTRLANGQQIGPLTVNKGRQKVIKELTRWSWGWLCSRFPQRMEAGWHGEAGGRWPPHGASAAHPLARTWTSSRTSLQPWRAAASNSSAPSLRSQPPEPKSRGFSSLNWKEVTGWSK